MSNAPNAKINNNFCNNKNVLIIVMMDIFSTKQESNVFFNVHKERTMISKVFYGLVNLVIHLVKFAVKKIFVKAVKMVFIFIKILALLNVQINILKINCSKNVKNAVHLVIHAFP